MRPIALLPRRPARLLGWALLGGAAVWEVWFVRTMRGAHTAINPTKPTTTLITWGPFRYSRNPSYLAFNAIYLGIASVVNSLWPLLLLPAAVLALQRGVIKREEYYLEHKFGGEYLRYKTKVRRWI